MRHYSQKHQRRITGFTARAADALLNYEFPGNIRELQNLVERGTIYANEDGPIDLPHLFTSGEEMSQSYFSVSGTGPRSALVRSDDLIYGDKLLDLLLEERDPGENQAWSLDRLESELIDAAFKKANGNLSAAARILGISRPQLAYLMKKQLAQQGGAESISS